MKVNKKVVYFVLLNIVIEALGLEVNPSVIKNNILETASAIRNVTNEIFMSLKLKGTNINPKLRQYSLIHNYFSALAAKDHDTLTHVSDASKFDLTGISNETSSLKDIINEILNEDPTNTNEESNKDDLQDHVNDFFIKLEYLKDINSVNNNSLNSQLLDILSNEEYYNVTQDAESDENDSDNEFWVPEQSGRRIYQGDKTKIKYFPFMASIQIFNNFQCGGCIIKSDLVISAASCLQLAWNNRFYRENPAFLSVRVGSNFFRAGGETIPVLEVYFHPEYDPKTLRNNICLLRLMRRIKFRKRSRRVKKIDFDRSPWNVPMTTDGITIVGWGAKGRNNIVGDPWSNRLSFSVLDIYPFRECQDIYSKQYVTKKNFCAGFFSKGGGACNGDVGGPGIVNGILAGIVSFGSPVCGTPDAPTVFTKLGYYSDWIENIMEQDVPNNLYRTTLKTTAHPFTVPRYNTLKPTTFVLEPIVGKWVPQHVNAVPDALRILDDEDLFKEFLSTMFGSKEAKEYEEFFVDTEKTKPIDRQKKLEKKDKTKKSRQTVESIDFLTKTFEDVTTSYPFTVMENTLFEDKKSKGSSDDEIEKNILKLIENIDVSDEETKKVVKKEEEIKIRDSQESDVSENDVLELFLNDEKNIPRQDKKMNVDDSILTLLYLSDNEQKNSTIESIGNVINDFDDNVNEGLSIALDGFKDLTFRDNGTGNVYNFLPKDEMYELLAEAIDEVAKSKEK